MSNSNKFEPYYLRSRVHEWRFVYLDYKLLRSMIKPFIDVVKLYSQSPDLDYKTME